MPADPVADEVFRHLFASIAEEMGVTLERTAFSPNIKERRDHSCAIFDAAGRLLAQAEHIPVHLGAFPILMAHLVPRFRWRPGDAVICNDPFVGGTHLPDISLVSPVFTASRRLVGFVANRAHHADVGGASPGSLSATTEIYQEGVIIPPLRLLERGRLNEELLELICRNVRTPRERRGDFDAQLAANETGLRRFGELLERYGAAQLRARAAAARRRTARAVERVIAGLPAGTLRFEDVLDDDGRGSGPLPVRVSVERSGRGVVVDFTGTAAQQPGSVNAPFAVTCSAVYYSLICLLPRHVELNQGALEPIRIVAPEGSLVNPRPPASVAAGNVETSQRITDVVLGALAQAFPDRLPAASQGTMNNLTLGGIDPRHGEPWAYYETLGGGAGAGPGRDAVSGIHCHMSNTRNTPAEALEYHYPLRVRRYALREGSGGEGRHRGGDGVVRELEATGSARAVLIGERRDRAPYGLQGGGPGSRGRNRVCRDGKWRDLPGKAEVSLAPGDRLSIETPGGGGWGEPSS
ncbi:MAG: hydantoinase B/oxoprolinase family protein [Armatimonadota bacterium]